MTILFYLAGAFVAWDMLWLADVGDWPNYERLMLFICFIFALGSDIVLLKFFLDGS